MSHQRTIDVQDGDEKWIAAFHEQLDMLTGMVEEMFQDNPRTLLSPIFRELLRDKARKVKAMHGKIRHTMCVDNLGDSLQEAQ